MISLTLLLLSAPPSLVGDLPALKRRGQVRFLIAAEDPVLARRGDPLAAERALAELFAARLGLKAELIKVESGDQYFGLLEEGAGDVVVASLTPTAKRKELATFTRPIRWVKQLVVTKAGDQRIKAQTDLARVVPVVRASSAHAERLVELGLPFQPAPEDAESLDLLASVARGELGATVVDSDLLELAQGFIPDLSAALAISERDPIAWAVRKDSPELKAALDAFLVEEALTASADLSYAADLAEIKKRRVLRILTRNASHCYYLHRGAEVGFEHDLAALFARALGVRLQVIVAPSRDALLSGLAEGKADLVAAGLTATDGRKQSFDFSLPYLDTEEVLVVAGTDLTTKGLADLKGQTISVRRSSSYWETLSPLAAQHGFTLAEAPEDWEAEEILQRVGSGELRATVVDSHLAEIERSVSTAIRVAAKVGQKRGVAWAFRRDQPALKAAADAFFKKGRGGLEQNLLIQRYFQSRAGMRASADPARADKGGKLSPYDALVRRYARQYELDWRLMTAQMYQESRFDPKAKSWVGAEGLMQVMPGTAKDLGFRSVKEPELGIHAGVKLLARYAALFSDPAVKEKDRIRFALASYNCGPGHVFDARRLAKELGLDPNRWFGNVEKALGKLAEPKYAARARYGYCRASEPIQYVSEIQTRYEAYSSLVSPD